MNQAILFVGLAVLAGSLIPFQTSMYSQLGKSLQSPFYSSLSVFIVAAIGLAVYIIINQLRPPGILLFREAPSWSYLGGIIGSSYVLLVTVLTPKLGIGNTTVLVLLGNILAAMLIDQFGLLGAAVHAINLYRFAGVVLIIVGVYLTKKF